MRKIIANNLLPIFFICVFLKQILWLSVIPLWHTPDEQAHFAQVQNTAEGNIPGVLSTSREVVESEKILNVFRDERGNNSFTYHPEYKIEYRKKSFEGRYEKEIKDINKSERKKLVKNEASGYPPLYYYFSAIGYKIVYSGSIIDRVFFVRFWQNIIYLLTIYVYYHLARSFFKSKVLIFSFLTFISFLPMSSFVGAGVTSDNLMNLLFPLPILVGVKVVKNGVKISYLIIFLMVFTLGFLTKPHFIITIPILAFSILIRKIIEKRVRVLFIYLLLFVFLLCIYYSQGILAFINNGEIESIVPDVGKSSLLISRISLSGAIDYLFITLQKTYRETLPWFWGVFRWLSFTLNRRYYRFFNFLLVVSAITLFMRVSLKIKSKKKISKDNLAEAFLYSSVAIYFAAITFWDYLFFLSHGFSLGMQGRYYFPVLFPIVFFIFKNISALLRKEVLIKMFGGVMILLNFYAIFEIAKSYYSFSSLKEFIFEFSQYKPQFFKGINIIIIALLYLIVLLVFLIEYLSFKHESSKN